jgi:hypothetical protein
MQVSVFKATIFSMYWRLRKIRYEKILIVDIAVHNSKIQKTKNNNESDEDEEPSYYCLEFSTYNLYIILPLIIM